VPANESGTHHRPQKLRSSCAVHIIAAILHGEKKEALPISSASSRTEGKGYSPPQEPSYHQQRVDHLVECGPYPNAEILRLREVTIGTSSGIVIVMYLRNHVERKTKAWDKCNETTFVLVAFAISDTSSLGIRASRCLIGGDAAADSSATARTIAASPRQKISAE
jgi:hypothetical protein